MVGFFFKFGSSFCSRVVYILRGRTMYVSFREGIGVLKEFLVVTGKKTEDTHKFHFFWREIWLQTFKKKGETKKRRKHRPTRFWLFFLRDSNLQNKKSASWVKNLVKNRRVSKVPSKLWKVTWPVQDMATFPRIRPHSNKFPSNNSRKTSFHWLAPFFIWKKNCVFPQQKNIG